MIDRLRRLLRRRSLGDIVRAEVAADRQITVIEPPGGLSEERRHLIAEAVELLAAGAEDEAADRFRRAGVSAKVLRMRGGKPGRV